MRDVARALLHALDPVVFARDRLGFEPDEWQGGLLRSSARWTLVLCSRQAGKSTTAAVLALHTALHRPGLLVLLVAPSLRQAGELFRKFAELCGRLDPAPALSEDNAASCTFAATGSRVLSLPGSEATVRGFSAPALVVEDARVPDALYRTIRPMLATAPAGRLILLSTPFGQPGS
jgi:phage terminase large subunit-like protein